MKKSVAVTLLVSGSILAGCDKNANDWSSDSGPAITNNTYVNGYGYWHAPYRNWYPFPYNYFRPGYGYYHGGGYSSFPEEARLLLVHLIRRGLLPGLGELLVRLAAVVVPVVLRAVDLASTGHGGGGGE